METVTMSPEIQKLADSFNERFDYRSLKLRNEVYSAAYKAYAHESMAMKTARAFALFLEQKPVVVWPFDVLAGQLQNHDFSASSSFKYDQNFDPANKKLTGTGIYDIVKNEIDDCLPFFENQTTQDKELLDMFLVGLKNGFFSHTDNGHAIAGFQNILQYGYDGLEQKVNEKLKSPDITNEQRDYLSAMLIVLQAAQKYIMRYAQAADQMLNDNVIKDKEKIRRVAVGCRNISTNPASTFFEAIQAILFLQELISLEELFGSMSFGRIDQLLYPYYVKDCKAKLITESDAQELIDAWRIKIAGVISGFQNVVIGGTDIEGNFIGNDITLMVLRSTRKLRYDQPLLSLRYSKNMPDDFWEETVRTLEIGDGFPALFNDDVIIPALINSGVEKEDAWNYGIVGCVEPSIGGKEFSNTEQMRINWTTILELMLNNGVCRMTGDRIALKTQRNLDSIVNYEDFLSWYKEELLCFIQRSASICNLIDRVYYKAYPALMLSVTMDDCIGAAQDACALGTKYRFSTIDNTEMANAVDALMAIKEMVFKKKMLTLVQLNDVLNADFEGHADIQAYMRNRCIKFGNGIEDADALMSELVDYTAEKINSILNIRGFHFRPGYYSVEWHAAMGARTGATADGRNAGISLANGFSPVQGADSKGPTAVINAVTRSNHKNFGNGMVLDLKFNPSFFKNPVQRKLLRPLTDTYFSQGGMELQFNVIDRNTLLAAQKDPQKYKHLLVRVSGFSAYFVSLYKVLQDEIIARTEYEHE